MEHIIIHDTAILAVNHCMKGQASSNIVYRDDNGKLHSIDFETCAVNFRSEHEALTENCIGERKIDEYFFIFYTSGVKTKVVFRKMYVGNLLHHHLLSGTKTFRFLSLRSLINESGYTTYDLS